MAVDQTALFREVDAIASTVGLRYNCNLEVNILVNGVWKKPLKLNHYCLERNYELGFGDLRTIDILIGLDVYTYGLLPHRDNLVVEIKYTPLSEYKPNGEAPSVRVVRYRGLLLEQANAALTGKHGLATSEAAQAAMGVRSVELQLLELSTYQLRLVSVGLPIRNARTIDVLQAGLAHTQQTLKLPNSERILGINITDGFNQSKRQQFSIPAGTPLIKLPGILQDKEGGIYATGLGCYFQDRYWWVYPLYDTTRFTKTKQTLTVFNVPNERYHGAERTFKVVDGAVTVLATGDASALDTTVFDYINHGNGVRFGDANQLLAKPAHTNDNRLLIDRATTTTEVSQWSMADGVHHMAWASDRQTSNAFKHYSEMARKKGTVVTLQWMHSNAEVLIPGMPVRFYTVSDDIMKQYDGVLLGVQEQRIPATPGMASDTYPGATVLRLFLNTDNT